MIICAALKIRNISTEVIEEEIIVPCIRHADGYALLRDLGHAWEDYDSTEGFVDGTGAFYDRKEAYWKAKEAGQLPLQIHIDKTREQSDELYSEDLY